MSDAKLFQIGQDGVQELMGQSVAVEKSLQVLLEQNLEAFLGVRFLASEYVTGKTHGGRIDTLGIDENGCPVIIEYKRALNENVINQGLFYLDWLMDHRADFTLLVMKQISQAEADEIEWDTPRLVCIAGDFTKYDEHAVSQINRNIELLRYRRYGDGLLLLELMNARTATKTTGASQNVGKTAAGPLAQAATALSDRFEALKSVLLALGDDVQMNTLKHYFAFKRIKNFACVEVHPGSGQLVIYIKVDPDTVKLVAGFTEDVRQTGHYGTGDLRIRIKSNADMEEAKALLLRSYDVS